MRLEETVLFLFVIALALALVIVVVAPILRQKRAASRPVVGGVSASLGAPAVFAANEKPRACPACHRQQPLEFRFCPFDGTPVRGSGAQDVVDASLLAVGEGGVLVAAGGKICPSCARRYRLDVAVCARDGSPLVAVN
jgi:hypothetical protein